MRRLYAIFSANYAENMVAIAEIKAHILRMERGV